MNEIWIKYNVNVLYSVTYYCTKKNEQIYAINGIQAYVVCVNLFFILCIGLINLFQIRNYRGLSFDGPTRISFKPMRLNQNCFVAFILI